MSQQSQGLISDATDAATLSSIEGLSELEGAGISAQQALFKAQKQAAANPLFDSGDIDRFIDSIGATDTTLGNGSLDDMLAGAGGLFTDLMAQNTAAAQAAALEQAGNFVSSQGGTGGFAQQAITNQLVASGGANGAAVNTGFLLNEANRQRDLRFSNQDSVLGALQLALQESQMRLQGPDTSQVTNISGAINSVSNSALQREFASEDQDFKNWLRTPQKISAFGEGVNGVGSTAPIWTSPSQTPNHERSQPDPGRLI